MSDFGEPNKPANPDMAVNASSDKDARMWSMILHLSMLSNCVIPIAGVVAPIIIWQIKKDEHPIVDVHGKNAVNWIISAVIYSVICLILVFAVIGIFLLFILGALSIVFPIMAGIKANNGEVWKYPMTIQFLK